MLFNLTKRGEFMKLVSSNAGQNNANTSHDRTFYYEVFPSNQLKLGLWLESERMLHPVINEVGVKTKNEVVKEEKRMRMDNQPYGQFTGEMFKRLFTKHPYTWQPIGSMADLDAATLAEFQAFFKKYYVPNNAVLSIAGDIDIAQTKELVNAYLEAMTMSMDGNPVMKTRFNGTAGYQEQMSQKKAMTPEEIKEKNAVTNLFEQLDYVKNPVFKAEVKGVEKVNGSDAYKLVITYPTGKTKTEFYDVASKLLVKTEEATTANNMTISNTVEFADYKRVGAILFPHTQTLTVSAGGQQQVMEMKAQSVKVNEGVTTTDFN